MPETSRKIKDTEPPERRYLGARDPRSGSRLERTALGVVQLLTKRTEVVVPWTEGLHLRPATHVVRSAQRYRSAILLKLGTKVANARSLLSVLTLCATLGATLEIEAVGDDEAEALAAIETSFTSEQTESSGSAWAKTER